MVQLPVRLARWISASALLLTCLFGTRLVSAQDALDPAQTVQVFNSPRAVLGGFMKGMRNYHELGNNQRKDLDIALACFPSMSPKIEPEELEALAIQLYESLNRMAVVDLQDLPLLEDDRNKNREDYTWNIPTSGPLSKAIDRVLFTRIRAGSATQIANWRFGTTLMARIPLWHETWKNAPVQEENREQISVAELKLSLPDRMRRRLLAHMPEVLRQRAFLLQHWQWIGLGVLAVVSALLGRLGNFVVRHLARRLERSERLRVDKTTLVGFERPFGLFVLVGVLLNLLPVLGLELRTYEVLRLAGAFFTSIYGVWSAYRLVDVAASILQEKANRTANRFDDILVPLVRRIAKIFLTLLGTIYVASYISDDLYGIVAGLSIGSLAIGFAAKDSIENLFGTMTVLLDKPYQLGDWITVGDIDGSVEEVGFRSTKIRTFYNSLISVPNSRFISAHIDNWGERRYRRIKTTVSISYGTPPLKIEAFCEGIRELVRKHPYTRKDYYHVYLNGLGSSSLDILVYCFVETPDWSTELREKHRLYLDILRVAEGLGVELAFPTQTLHIVKGDEEAMGPAPGKDARTAERMGRELADLIVREGLSEFPDRIPPPVTID